MPDSFTTDRIEFERFNESASAWAIIVAVGFTVLDTIVSELLFVGV